MKKSILLKIGNQEIYYNRTDFILIKSTNLPFRSMTFKTENMDIFWEVELIEFDKENKELFVKVLDYNPSKIDSFINQKSKFPFYRIKFDLLDWDQVHKQLSSYKELDIKDYFIGLTTSDKLLSSTKSLQDFYSTDKGQAEFQTENNIIDENHKVPIKDFRFHMGFVSATIVLKSISLQSEIVIHNPLFRQEFEYIKDYFIKYLGRKNVLVKVQYELNLGNITNVICTCQDLERIDNSVIEDIKVKRTNILTKPGHKEAKIIVDLDEIFNIILDNSRGINIFNQSEEDIVTHFINSKGVNNRQQLSYLATNIQRKNDKLRFTINRVFGFLFSYSTKDKFFNIWELLNSHATYIWFVNKNEMTNPEFYNEIERAIEYNKTLGRDKYKRAFTEGLINRNIQFMVLTHNRTDAKGFINWQSKLNSIIE